MTHPVTVETLAPNAQGAKAVYSSAYDSVDVGADSVTGEKVIALGEAPDPGTGQRQRELPHAAGIIDLLTLLREKTEGNRSTEETQVLDDLIYDLQLRYVNAAKSPG